MANRNRRHRGTHQDNPFAIEQESATFETVDRQGYGGPLLGKLDKHINARPIPIDEISPDPTQPRRTIPSKVRQRWNGKMDTLFDTWRRAVVEERGDESFDIMLLLHAEGDEIRNPTPEPVEAALLGVIDLAASILRDGLTNPITIVKHKDNYLLETGERRWLAYHLLYRKTGDEQWSKIPARVMDEFSVWRQAGENNARDNLNAIGRARQLSLLLMDLYREENISFDPFEKIVQPGGCDRAFYAQVADGEKWRIPRGKAELLLNATGLKGVRQLSQYRALLTLPDEAWALADDTNLSEYRLRQILDMKLDEATTVKLVGKAAMEYGSDSGTVVPVSEKQPDKNPVQTQVTNAEQTQNELPLLTQDDRKNLRRFMAFMGNIRLSDIPDLDKRRKYQVVTWARQLKTLAEKIEQAAGESSE